MVTTRIISGFGFLTLPSDGFASSRHLSYATLEIFYAVCYFIIWLTAMADQRHFDVSPTTCLRSTPWHLCSADTTLFFLRATGPISDSSTPLPMAGIAEHRLPTSFQSTHIATSRSARALPVHRFARPAAPCACTILEAVSVRAQLSYHGRDTIAIANSDLFFLAPPACAAAAVRCCGGTYCWDDSQPR